MVVFFYFFSLTLIGMSLSFLMGAIIQLVRRAF